MRGWPPPSPWIWPPSGTPWVWPPTGESSAPPLPTTFEEILGSNLVLEFNTQFSSPAGSWVDHKAGVVCVQVGAILPVRATDPGYFDNLPVEQFTQGSYRNFTPPVTVWQPGAYPYVFTVSRARQYVDQGIIGVRVTDNSNNNYSALYSSSPTQLMGISNQVFAAVATFSDTQVHAFELWADPAGTYLAIDGTTVATGPTAVLATPSRAISIGGDANGNSLLSRSSQALNLLCTAVPTTQQRAQVLALAKSIWKFGPP